MVGVILATVLILILSLIMPVTMPFYLGYGTILLMIVIFLIVGCSIHTMEKSGSYKKRSRLLILK